MNVAYHLRQLGLTPYLVSAVGCDLLGDELLRRIRGWGMDTDGIARHPARSTGYVRALLGAGGDARYEIATGVAWDEITLGEHTVRQTQQAAALVFGSLALRTPANRAVLACVLAALPEGAWRVFDVNLRPPYDDLGLVRELAAQATLLKMNSAEAARLGVATGDELCARHLAEQTGCPTVCVTAGARGAGLLQAGRWYWEPARPVAVVDTVGAGDAFLAALLASQLAGAAPERALARACRLGAFVAGCAGATPVHPAAMAD
ncbi:MAG: carbohydrate kinase [Opitutae bacterium]|nr:carbohydrate kinase [Opitutae bacterium]